MSTPVPRLYFLQRLRQELLGPRGGPDEVLREGTDPREEYTTGVLDSPAQSSDAVDELELLEGEAVGEGGLSEFDEDEPEDPLLLSAQFAPSVDPRLLPCSIGVTFFLRTGDGASFQICVSGGRYRCSKKVWSRQSYCWPLEPLDSTCWNSEHVDEASGFKVVVRSRVVGDSLTRVSLYLLNTGSWEAQTRERPSRFLYQPQIRVLLGDGCELVGLSEWGERPGDKEEQRLQLLYRKAPVKARGHMCAAVWREIDPEAEAGSPFEWTDSRPVAEAFAQADVRTELLPMIAVPTPLADWRDELGPAPITEALALSELPPEGLEPALRPLLKAYEDWLEACQKEAEGLPERYAALASEHLAFGREALLRMQSGLRLLVDDPEAYLAFAFANRAVHLQASWAGGSPLRWRPFQLGFLLLCLEGLHNPQSPDREICDLLWFPTGGGKTEAYLALTAYTLGLRRLRHEGYDGVGVLSRYTLRLLSIQQFRRALKLVTACEMLRVTPCDGKIGWRPDGVAEGRAWLWGRHRFSAGLWLGGAVTPNRLEGLPHINLPGAFDILEGRQRHDSDPAQVTECPVCATSLALADAYDECLPTELVLHLRVKGVERTPQSDELSTAFVQVQALEVTALNAVLSSLKFTLHPGQGSLTAEVIDDWWGLVRARFGEGCSELAVRASRPGYFLDTVPTSKGKMKPYRIEVYCPDPACPTARHPWREMLPMALGGEVGQFQPVSAAVTSTDDPTVARQCPIPAVTVDEQLYCWPPSLLVSTVDKFARLAFEPRAANLFGNVEYYHATEGFYRAGCLRASNRGGKGQHPAHEKKRVVSPPLPPLDLVIQDELHLIDGPLGSMVGLYETAVSQLCGAGHRLKYVASTATVREATDQVRSLFARDLRQFPPPSLDANDSFFALLRPGRLMQERGPGRLYLGYSAPGRGALTPQVRVWAVLLQAAQELRAMGIDSAELDPYWSPVGYFTAIRNLASTAGLWRQAIPLRLKYLGGDECRDISSPVELSSRIASSRLPGILNRLGQPLPGAVDGVLSTSMFGTGVDVSRLSLMLVHGQPKTTSSYIQATGRVGRQSPGLIVTNLPATNPRSLDHYEFFTGYHRQLYRGVEPVTVYPFAPRARERALGPLCVALLRQLRGVDEGWRDRAVGARLMAQAWERPEVRALVRIFEARAQEQPDLRRPDLDALTEETQAALKSWKDWAEKESALLLEEYTMTKLPESPVVLGDHQHQIANLGVVFANAPQSLREIEPTTGFKI